MASEPEDEPLPTSPRRSPSFKGRLKLEDFVYKDSTQPARRSARLLVAGSPAAAPGSSGRKRARADEAADDDNDNDNDNDNDSNGHASAAPDSPPPPKGTARPLAIMPKRQRTRAATPDGGARKGGGGYAPPSTYAHLSGIPDALGPGLLVMLVGLNPGVQTARTGHAFAHPTNLFWRLVHTSGMTARLCAPREHLDLPRLFALGLTNIVARPSRNGAELARRELDAGVAALEAKARRWRPEVVCTVGKSIYEAVFRVRHGRPMRKHEFNYGWQDESENMGTAAFAPPDLADDGPAEGVVETADWAGARMFVAPSTSGLAATLSFAQKQAIWDELGAWVQRRRAERAAAAEGP